MICTVVILWAGTAHGAGNTSTTPFDPDIIYDPSTGTVVLSASEVFFDAYQIEVADDADFDESQAVFAFQPYATGGISDLNASCRILALR